MVDWLEGWVDAIKTAKDDVELARIVDKIYMDGYADGVVSECK